MQVTKQQIDDYTPGKAVPCCTLLAEYQAEPNKAVKRVQHRVELIGAEDPFDMFVLDLPAECKDISSSAQHLDALDVKLGT